MIQQHMGELTALRMLQRHSDREIQRLTDLIIDLQKIIADMVLEKEENEKKNSQASQ